MPIHNKQDVFNEWGAIVRHQDEIDQKAQKLAFEKQKLRQVNYKKELDKQYKELMDKRKGFQGERMKKEEELIQYQQKLIEDRAKNDQLKRQKLVHTQKEDAKTGYQELLVKKHQDQIMRDMERDMQKQKIAQEQKIQQDMQANNLLKKKKEESEYYQMLTLQAKERQYKQRQDKEADKQFGIAETEKLNNEEKLRNQFFSKLKKIQEKNDEKHHRLLKYMSQDAAVLNSKKDEQAHLRNIELSEKKEVKKEFVQKQHRDISKKDNNLELDKQMNEK